MATPLSQRLTQARTQRYKASIRPKQGSAHLKDRRKKSGATLCLTLSFSLFLRSFLLALLFSLFPSRFFILALSFLLFLSRSFFYLFLSRFFFLAFSFSLFLSSFFLFRSLFFVLSEILSLSLFLNLLFSVCLLGEGGGGARCSSGASRFGAP